MKKLQVRLNPYLEFINSILLTGKYNEITAPGVGYGLMNEEENEYTTAVRAHFEPYTAISVSFLRRRGRESRTSMRCCLRRDLVSHRIFCFTNSLIPLLIR